MVIIHGICEYSGRYIRIGETLAKHGYATSALDLRGHGKSEGYRSAD